MKTTKVKAAGYVRVSTPAQTVEGKTSLDTQRESIKRFAKQQGYQLTEIYADEGISGGSVKERHALLQCLEDSRKEQFNVLIVHRLSRFGRNARELLDNHEQLKQANIELRSISEGIDFSTKYGQAFLGILAVIAQLERDVITETMLENRIAKGRKGIPTSGKLPYGRIFDKATNQWKLDDDIVRQIQWAADEYLKGGRLYDIAETLQMSYMNLKRTLTKCSGNTWTVGFEGEEPITYNVPRLLSDEIIQRIRERLQFNRHCNRTDIKNKYVLSGFLRCEYCGASLIGQTQKHNSGIYRYYAHISSTHSKCKAFNEIRLEPIEHAVFETIFDNMIDVPSFERAIAESMPDEKMVHDLEHKIQTGEKELKRVNKELNTLVNLALSGTLTKETIKDKEQELLKAKTNVEEALQCNKSQLHSLPDVATIKEQAEQIRRQLLERFTGKERLQEMSFDEKRTLLHWLFDGRDHKGTPYGIYINKTGKRKEQKVDYFLYGRIIGLRTLKGDNIDYQENEQVYKTNKNAFYDFYILNIRI